MSRSLTLSFLIALTIHFLLSQVQLNLFKRPIPEKGSLPKALTIDIIAPTQVIKPALSKKTEEKNIEIKKTNLRPDIKPAIKKEKNIKTREQITKDKETKEDRVLVTRSLQQDLLVTKTKYIESMEYDMPARNELNTSIDKDMPETARHKDSPDLPPFIQTSYSLPAYRETPAPEYPIMAERRGYQGTVILDVLVNKDGKAESVQLAKSSGYDILDRAAIKGVREWLFHPAKKGDELVDAWVKIPIKFQLE